MPNRAELFDDADESGVVTRRRGQTYRAADTLGAAVLIATCGLGLEREDDTADNVCATVGSSPLRGAAWLRSRGAAVGHAASRSRLLGVDAAAYQAASQARVARHSHKTALSFAAIRSAQIADWLRPDRRAIILVGPGWATASAFHAGRERVDPSATRALVVVGAAMGSLVLYDPCSDGRTEETSFADADELRSDPRAAWEVMLAAIRG